MLFSICGFLLKSAVGVRSERGLVDCFLTSDDEGKDSYGKTQTYATFSTLNFDYRGPLPCV